jgi:hypothetical protein
MHRLAVALLALLAVPSASSAAPLNELPFQSLPDRDTASCLRPTGVPGGLALFARPGATDLWHADASGMARRERARLGRLQQCAAAAAAGDAAVLAGVVARGEVHAAIRDAGGAFGPPARLGAGSQPQDVAVAVSPAGHAAVVWTERRGDIAALRSQLRVVIARRLPGQGFSAPEPLTGWWTSETFSEPRPAVGVDARGTTTVIWSRELRRRYRERATVAVAAPGGGFAVQRLGSPDAFGDVPAALAVAPDGWTVVVHGPDARGLGVFERAPGTARFTRIRLSPRSDAYHDVRDPAAAVGNGGGAVVAWRTGAVEDGGVAAMTRGPGGSFALPEVVSPARRSNEGGSLVAVALGGSPPVDADADRLRAQLGPGGRVLLAWTGGRRGEPASVVRAATGGLGVSFDPAQIVSGPLRDAEAPAPLFLEDGRAAVAWVDNASAGDASDGRVHLAVEDVAQRASEIPRLRLRADRTQRLFPSEPVRVTTRCDRPCDVLGTLAGADELVSTTLPGAARAELELPRYWFTRAARRSGQVKVEVSAAEPGGRTPVRRSMRIEVLRRPPLPLRRPLDVRARRRGEEIVVRWRTAGPARRMYFSVLGRRTLRPAGIDFSATQYRNGRGRARFVARLRPDRPRRVRWVAIVAGSYDRARTRTVIVPVR